MIHTNLYIGELSDCMCSFRNGWWIAKENIWDNAQDNEISLADFFEDIYNPSPIELSLFKLKTGIHYSVEDKTSTYLESISIITTHTL